MSTVTVRFNRESRFTNFKALVFITVLLITIGWILFQYNYESTLMGIVFIVILRWIIIIPDGKFEFYRSGEHLYFRRRDTWVT